MADQLYGEAFRDAYSLLHGGRPDEGAAGAERNAGEKLEAYLARTRGEALGSARKRLLAQAPPPVLAQAHDILLRLLVNAAAADEALAEQIRSYQCGQFHESVRHSDRLQELVVESQRLDRELINCLGMLPRDAAEDLGIEL